MHLLVLLALTITRPCYGLELLGRATTEFAWWQDLIDRDTKFPAYQYLRLGSPDVVKDQNISVFGYGRYGYNEVANDEARIDHDIYERYTMTSDESATQDYNFSGRSSLEIAF